MAGGMRSVNEVVLIGWVANDPIIKEAQNGQKLTVFNLGTRRVWTTKDNEQKEEVQYHKIAAWGRMAERAEKILDRGSKVYIRGYLHNRKVEIEGEEKPRIITEIVINDLLVLGRKRKNSEGGDDAKEENESEDTQE
ncbi:single-stranded DNA-binding protein [Candidatus Absconditicoccus praedator]|uniref:single-stranded DNA-binding protein n=1 Tax=Candidatus Absconditicoccus praedator TaxID=2735562 RepID=UPI001E516F6A|nr:single-stranded DNA-binding protein [Candidatus Absconditicoccus praedator]UFX82532.1 single-stranded DNA-binding protein [Candidatus Absconditicoccus praedator]